jgi:ketosteroid isomerase-like protein
MSGFLAHLNELDLSGMVAYFADDVTAFVPTAQAELVSGKAELTDVFARFVAQAKAAGRTDLGIVPEKLTLHASEHLGIIHFQVRDPIARDVSRRTFVFRCDLEGWKIIHFHASDLTIPPVP